MFEPSASSPTVVSTEQVQAFTAADAQSVLYGIDHTASVVAIELAGQSDIAAYVRNADGSTSRSTRPFTPWLIAADPAPWETPAAVTSIEQLAGANPLRYRVSFGSWDDFRNLTANLRDPETRTDIYLSTAATSQFQMTSGLTLFKGMDFEDVRRMQLDIETLGLDPTVPEAEVIMIAIRQGEFEEVLVQTEGEVALLEELNNVFQRLDPDVIEGHNIYSFDFPYLVERSRRNGVRLALGRDGSPPQVWNNQQRFRAGPVSLPYTAVNIHGRHIVDTLHQIQRHDVQGNLTGYGLKGVVRELGIEREDREFVAGQDIAGLWRSGERDRQRLARYALDDVRDVDLLSRITTPTEFYQTQILPMTYQRATVSGTGKKIDDLMVRAYLSAGHSIPLPGESRGFPGGYTSVLHAGVFGPIVKADVESLYPSIMSSRNISPKSDTLGSFPILLKDLTRRRLEAKARVRTAKGEERARWDALQGSFKILINSFYGYLGFGIGHFNDFDAAEAVTLEGQRIIKQVVGLLERTGANPIEVDTDGVYFRPPDGVTDLEAEEAYVEKISGNLAMGIRLAHDGRYARMLSLKMKTYALLDHEGNLTLKGSALRSRRMERCFQEFIRTAARGFMLDQRDEVRDAYFELAERIQKKQLEPSEIGQWAMLRRATAEKSPRLSRLLRATQGQWRFGERVVMYEREDGELGLMQNYANDENTPVLLRRLKETANRFEGAFTSPAEFEAFFPNIQVTTNLEAARNTQPVEQLGLF
jgi:DNA polymerase elongation subunit (family B)